MMVCGAPGRFKIAVVIRKTLHRIGVADVNPLRIFSWRIKRNAERLI